MNVYAKFRVSLRIEKALGIFRELITTTRRRTTIVAFWDPPSGYVKVVSIFLPLPFFGEYRVICFISRKVLTSFYLKMHQKRLAGGLRRDSRGRNVNPNCKIQRTLLLNNWFGFCDDMFCLVEMFYYMGAFNVHLSCCRRARRCGRWRCRLIGWECRRRRRAQRLWSAVIRRETSHHLRHHLTSSCCCCPYAVLAGLLCCSRMWWPISSRVHSPQLFPSRSTTRRVLRWSTAD